MPTTLNSRYPGLRHFMLTVLLGDGTFEDELVGYVLGVSAPEFVEARIAEIRALLDDPEATDDAVDDFVLGNARRFVDGSGRRTLEHAADRLQAILDDPPLPHPLTSRAPALAAFLESFTRSRDDLEALVTAGAEAVGPEGVAEVAGEARALSDDPGIGDLDLSRFVRAHSWWLVGNSGRRTLQRVLDALGAGAPSGGGPGGLGADEARAAAERFLDGTVRQAHDDEIVIVDRHTQESDGTWAFVYNTRAYVESGDMLDMLVGNAPVLVDKATGETRLGRTDLTVAEQLQ